MCFFSLQKHKQAVPVKIIQYETPMDLEDEIKKPTPNLKLQNVSPLSVTSLGTSDVGGYSQWVIWVNACVPKPCHNIFYTHSHVPGRCENFPEIDFVQWSSRM